VRILFTTWIAPGHLRPMVPLAWALRAQGHDVMVTTPPNTVGYAVNAGLSVKAIGEHTDPIAAMKSKLPPGVTSMVERWGGRPPRERYHRIGRANALLHAEYVAEQLEFARAWKPDVIVHEPMDLTGRVVAAVLDIPSVLHRWGIDDLQPWRDGAKEGMADTCAKYGISPDDLDSSLIVDPCPASIQRSDAAPGLPIRYVPFNGAAEIESWMLEPPTRRRVCVTLGNVTVGLGGAPIVKAIFEAVRDLDVDVVAALPAADRHLVGEVGEHVNLMESVPIGLFLPTCDLVIHHGGTGTSFTCIDLGRPQFIFPQLTDEFEYGDRIESLGVGFTLESPGDQKDVEMIRERLVTMLAEDSFDAAAKALQQEEHARPAPAEVATQLTDFVAGWSGR
jgi:UDP:flavonoid glycosyltransferase YjiC (YdhE family)